MDEGTIALVSFVMTLMVFSYVLGDLPLARHVYRTAVYIFVGMSAAFTVIVAVESVILPYWRDVQDASSSWTSLGNGADMAVFGAAMLFGLLLLLKPIASLSWLTNAVLAVVIVVSAAAALVGALQGTLIPLALAAASVPAGADLRAMIDALIVFAGTAAALLYFQWQWRRGDDGRPLQGAVSHGLRAIGKVFIVVTLGAIYATTMLSALTILSERVAFLFQLGG